MKLFSIFSTAALLAVAAGCATQERVATLDGQGTKRVYAATFDQAWRAAVDAAQQDGLQVVSADRARGYITARRTNPPHRFAENISIWVRQTTSTTAEVEVVSRDVGPPVVSLRTWEGEVQRAIAANLTRETAIGAAPRDVIIDRGSGGTTIVVPERRETVIVPSTTPVHEALREEQRQIEALRLRQQTGERALANEVDETKRDMLRREVDRLREDIKLQERRLRDLERELR